MSDLMPFMVYDTSGSPLLGASPTFVNYVSRAGVVQSPQPTISEIGGGQYGFTVPDSDVDAGVAFVIDCGVLAAIRYVQGAVFSDDNPFAAVLVTDFTGALYSGVGTVSFATYKDGSGNSRLPQPTISAIASNYLFSFAPSAADLLVDVAWTLTGPVDGDLNIEAGGFIGVDDVPESAPIVSRLDIRSTPIKIMKALREDQIQTADSHKIVTIDVIDRAVRDWFDLTMAVHTKTATQERKKVPVVFASGERWVTSRGKTAIRDTNGVLILPLISVRRVSVESPPDQSSLGIETPSIQISRQILGPKTNNLHNIYGSRAPVYRGPEEPTVYEVATIPFPHRAQLLYELVIQTQYSSQMNEVLQKLFSQLDVMGSFVAPFENPGRQPPLGDHFEDRKNTPVGYCVGYFDAPANDEGNLEEFTDQERVIRYSNSFRVPAVLQLDPEGEKPAVKIERTSFRLNMGPEQVTVVETEEDLERIFGKNR